MEIIPDNKTCTKCKLTKALSEFYKNKSTSDGHNWVCKPCDKAGALARYYANRDANMDRMRQRYADNREKYKQEAVERRAANGDHHRELARERYKKNKEGILEMNRAWRRKNPDKYKESLKRWNAREENKARRFDYYSKRRALQAAADYEKFDAEDVIAKWGIDCHLCMEPVDLDAPRTVGAEGWERGLHLEHVIALSNGGSHTLDNVKPSHGICNLRKSYKH
jgi:hypothetical protein